MINFEAEKANRVIANRRLLLGDLGKADSFGDLNKKLREKIEKWCEKHTFSVDDCFAMMKESEMFAAHFINDPIKQNFYENVVADFLSTRVDNFVRLRPQGPESFQFGDTGVVMQGDSPKSKLWKSMDFMWTIEDHTVFVSHKYINDDGGAQDNQFNDQQSFIINGVRVRKEPGCKIIFGAICDGPYFRRKDRFHEMDLLIDTPGVVIGTHDSIINLVSQELTKIKTGGAEDILTSISQDVRAALMDAQ